MSQFALTNQTWRYVQRLDLTGGRVPTAQVYNCFDTLNDVTIAGTVNNWGRCPPRFQLSRKYLHKPNHEMCKF